MHHELVSKLGVIVGSDGSISPCVMKQIPVKGENYYYVRGEKQPLL